MVHIDLEGGRSDLELFELDQADPPEQLERGYERYGPVLSHCDEHLRDITGHWRYGLVVAHQVMQPVHAAIDVPLQTLSPRGVTTRRTPADLEGVLHPFEVTRGLAATAAVLVLLLSGGCNAASTVPDQPVAPVPQVSQSNASSPATEAAEQGTEAADNYFTALVTNDPETMDEGQRFAAKGSIASAYLKHLSAVEGALLDSGSPSEPDDLSDDLDDATWGYCPEVVEGENNDPDCVKWTDVKFSGGLLSEFKVNGLAIDKRISEGSGDVVKSTMADVKFVTAYQSVTAKAVYVTFEIKAKRDLTANLYDAKYRGPDGRQTTATVAIGPDDLEGDSSSRGYVVFKGAKPGGVVTFNFYDSDYNDHLVKIKTS